jgi:integrase
VARTTDRLSSEAEKQKRTGLASRATVNLTAIHAENLLRSRQSTWPIRCLRCQLFEPVALKQLSTRPSMAGGTRLSNFQGEHLMDAAIKPFRVSIVQRRGTPYEIGCAQGQLFAATKRGRAFARRRTVKFPWWFKLRTEERVFAKFSPSLWEEIAGLADGLGISMERAVFCFGNNGLRPPIGACSAIITARLLCQWIASIRLDPKLFGTHSLRRTKATLIYRRTGNLRAVQLLLGHTKIESTVRYLGVEVDDALRIAEQVDV